MVVADFIALDKTGAMYEIVDASVSGFMTNPHVLIEADRNVIKPRFGNCELKGFAPKSKTTITLYVIPEVKESTFIDGVLRYLDEDTKTTIKLPDWANKALADKMSKDITGIQVKGDSVDITSNVNGKQVTYNVNKNGKVTQK